MPGATDAQRGELFRRALAWTTSNRAHLARGPDLPFTVKAVGEIAMAAELVGLRAGRRNDPGIASTAAALLRACWTDLDAGRAILEVVRTSHQLLYAAVYPPFARAGLRCVALEDALTELSRTLDIPPYLSFPLASIMEEVGLVPVVPVGDAYAESAIACEPPVAGGPELAVYAVAHEIVYLTDRGRSPDKIPPRAAAFLEAALPAWRARFLAEGQMDLTAELVIAEHCRAAACVEDEVWRALAAAQRPDGLVAFSTRAPVSVRASYHSTLAALMATAMCDH